MLHIQRWILKTMKWIRKFKDSFQSLCDLLCVSLWTGPPIHKLAAKLDDLRASLSLTSSSTRCRSLDASDWDSSNKSPAGNREILSLSGTTSLYYISTCTVIFKYMINFGEKFCGRSTAFDESETKHSDLSDYRYAHSSTNADHLVLRHATASTTLEFPLKYL